MSTRFRALLMTLLIAASVAFAWLPASDSVGQTHVDDALRRALVGYALARGLNGVISVAQGTEVAIQPAGVGVNFTPGEILDPINDLVERFSWIMMLAASSLGIQKVLLSMSAWNGLLIGLIGVGGLLVMVRWLGLGWRRPLHGVQRHRDRWMNARFVLQRVFLFLLILRFMMPAISVTNDWVYRTFLAADYVEATAALEQARESIGEINDAVEAERVREPGTLLDRARDLYQQALDTVDVDKRLDEYRAAAESVSENTLRLIVVFLMQTLVFPLIFLYIVMGLIRRLTRLRP